jgi:hypothetical protein
MTRKNLRVETGALVTRVIVERTTARGIAPREGLAPLEIDSAPVR